ncbi:glycosyltransferase family 2 protein [Sandaracinobacteroides hominis]|uniref:glycosyltransferase family 2 protein n=1 Tax=Sandaracinobacteroides hominis TaxID=2780086 RepID=UPI0018F413CE|nr:glycosyltransferase family 2 protein [Sandaracinobacteroides hominis]
MMDSAPMGRQLFVNVLEEERVLDEEESASESGLTTNEDGQPAFQWPEASAGTAELGVVLVCYNGWSDTIECLESLLRSDLPIRVAVVDNASTDGSAEKIRAWAEGALPYEAPDNALSQLSSPPLPKPVAMDVLSGEEAGFRKPGGTRLVLIESQANLGFAGGNNLGMRHLFRDPNIAHVWLLNNDTVVEPSAARAVLSTLKTDPWIGMVGTVLRYYHSPETLQALNGMDFNILTGNSKGLYGGKPASTPFDARKVARQTEFVLGASLAVSRRFVETVGLMSEAYFLYFEEIDWARRNGGRFAMGFARGATVYHKHGGSIGSSAKVGGRSPAAEYWLLRAKLLFYRRYHPLLLPVIWLQGCVQTSKRVLRRQPASVRAMTKALFFRPL